MNPALSTRIDKVGVPLKACCGANDNTAMTRFAAAKSPAALGDDSVTAMLCIGLRRDGHHTRCLSGI